ncbi:hypothetical protein DL240_04750 [Lujinxingia litoralis]|uniref:Uncharacterized protein n=1 Tax=Lujinxingia litoralis TaxID=2211119 RepID=A0A328CEU6_9DELT|nr:hypothetical protein [Lujinxingia litoralis]RAL25523.1 hypothetical protein DL240_04750 [Lujinxingia litoralis]
MVSLATAKLSPALALGAALLLAIPASAGPPAPALAEGLNAWQGIERLEVRRIVETRVEGNQGPDSGDDHTQICTITFQVSLTPTGLTLSPKLDPTLFEPVRDPAEFPHRVERLGCLVPTLHVDRQGQVRAANAAELAREVTHFFDHFVAAQHDAQERQRVQARTRSARQSLSPDALQKSAATWWSVLGLRLATFPTDAVTPAPCLEPTPAPVHCARALDEATFDLSQSMRQMYQGAAFRLVSAAAHQQATARFRSDQAPPYSYTREIRQVQRLVHRYTDQPGQVVATNTESMTIRRWPAPH